MAEKSQWRAVREMTDAATQAAKVATVAAVQASVAAAGEVVTAAIEAVPVRDDPRGPAVISDAAALYLILAILREHGTAEVKQAMEANMSLIGWIDFMEPPPLGDG